jgi:hypothetical protein
MHKYRKISQKKNFKAKECAGIANKRTNQD